MVYDANMAVKWSSGQQGQAQYLKVKDDGTMVVYAQDGQVIWTTVQRKVTDCVTRRFPESKNCRKNRETM